MAICKKPGPLGWKHGTFKADYTHGQSLWTGRQALNAARGMIGRAITDVSLRHETPEVSWSKAKTPPVAVVAKVAHDGPVNKRNSAAIDFSLAFPRIVKPRKPRMKWKKCSKEQRQLNEARLDAFLWSGICWKTTGRESFSVG